MLNSRSVQVPDRRRYGTIGKNGSPSLRSLLNKFFARTLDEDLVAYDKNWLLQSGLHRQLDVAGYRLRWVDRQGTNENLRNGWEYVTVSHLIWWRRRIRRPNRPGGQYLMKRLKALPK